jgi:hypothetical protein
MEAYVGVRFHLHLPRHLGSGMYLLGGRRRCIPLLQILAPVATLHALDAFSSFDNSFLALLA